MDSNEKIINDWNTLDNADIDKVCSLLRLHEHRIQDYLADCVAAACGVDKSDMMTNVSELSIIHSRWLFWYAYRYMTNEPFIRISNITSRYGKKFTEQSIANCVNKMGNMIANETIWTKRWVIIRRIIKLRDVVINEKDGNETLTMRIIAPKGIKVELKNE